MNNVRLDLICFIYVKLRSDLVISDTRRSCHLPNDSKVSALFWLPAVENRRFAAMLLVRDAEHFLLKWPIHFFVILLSYLLPLRKHSSKKFITFPLDISVSIDTTFVTKFLKSKF